MIDLFACLFALGETVFRKEVNGIFNNNYYQFISLLLKINTMKKIILLSLCVFQLLLLQAQVVKTVNLTTSGTLSTTLSNVDKNTITNLTINGFIDARDFKTMRDSMLNLGIIDLTGAHIAAYSGSNGTDINGMDYAKNEIPQFAFKPRYSNSLLLHH